MNCFYCNAKQGETDLITIHDQTLCINCKPLHLQREREGVSDLEQLVLELEDNEQLTTRDKTIVLFFFVVYLLFWVLILLLAFMNS